MKDDQEKKSSLSRFFIRRFYATVFEHASPRVFILYNVEKEQKSEKIDEWLECVDENMRWLVEMRLNAT